MLSVSSQEVKIKEGWNFGALPVVSYDTDLGLEYGALAELYYFGDGSIYPDYYHKLYFELSRFTKGSAIYRFNYESEHLIPIPGLCHMRLPAVHQNSILP
jgi:hypothetical protein